jgi:hypothetical protein
MKTNKKPYCKPQLEEVQLVSKSDTLGNCKGSGSSKGPGSTVPVAGCRYSTGGECKTLG